MAGVGEILVKGALRRGAYLLVDADGRVKVGPRGVKVGPRGVMSRHPRFRQLLNKHYERVKRWLIADAITAA